MADSVVLGAVPVLRSLSGTDERLVASALLVVGAVVVAALFAPAAVRWARRFIAHRFLGGRLAAVADEVTERFPLTTPVRLVLRGLQATVLVTTSVALLAVWNRTDAALTVLSAVQVSPVIVGRGVLTAALLVGAYVGMGLLEDTIESFSQGTTRMTAHQEQIITRVGQLSMLLLVGLLSLSVWNVNPQGLLVGAGFLGIVVGFAARQTLGSLIAGFVLMFSRPFEIGDWVVVGDDQEGVVTDITIINTRLENFDGEFIVIPNDKVADSPVTNKSQKGRLRLRVDVGIDYDADPERAEVVALEAIRTVETVTETPPPKVFPKSFGDSAVVLEMRFWIERPTPPKKWRTQAAVVNAVKDAFDREGIKIPYPQRELSGRAETGGFRVAEERAEAERYPDGHGPRG
ncbi:mechanosensitive ion channel family protein [Halorientalis marina]|uniref:mechanosensitive ion channel family protein n=1 Tax=Halorientalis marina TaxID=2931976 RepID=UPI001FF6AC2C|nr:mechanosensitive ion channel family protein [Halorientalis marina]